MDPTWVVVRNAFHTTKRVTVPWCKRAEQSLWFCSQRAVLVVSDETNHGQQRNPHDSELHAWPGVQDGRCPEHIFRLLHLTVTLITFCSENVVVFLFVCLFFVTEGLVSTLNHNLVWSIAQQLFTELQNKQSDCSTHNISHHPVLFLVVLFGKKKKKKYYKV